MFEIKLIPPLRVIRVECQIKALSASIILPDIRYRTPREARIDGNSRANVRKSTAQSLGCDTTITEYSSFLLLAISIVCGSIPHRRPEHSSEKNTVKNVNVILIFSLI